MAHVPFEPTIAGGQALPPYVATGVRLFGFPLVADAQHARDVCNKVIGIAPANTGISFEPVLTGPNICSVILEVLDYPSLSAPTPPWNDLGGVAQQELFFSIPVVRKQNGQVLEVGTLVTHIFVDDQGSAFTGREVLGLPKMPASFTLSRAFPQGGPIIMRVQGRKTVGGPIQVAQLVTIGLSFTRVPETPARISRFLGPIDALFAHSNYFDQIEAANSASAMPGFSSRVLIDPENPDQDAYRSVMRAVYASNVTATQLLPFAVPVKLSSLVHLDIRSTLGIFTDAAGVALSTSPYIIDVDFTLGNLTTLWHD